LKEHCEIANNRERLMSMRAERPSSGAPPSARSKIY
jgi:hypothetical protein